MAALAPTGIVGFRATYLIPGGGAGVQPERSQFVREDGAGSASDAMG